MHTLLASRPNVLASTRVDATRRDAVGVNGALYVTSSPDLFFAIYSYSYSYSYKI